METAIKNKPLGFWLLTSLVVGNMVGSGIFLLPTSLAKFGSISLFSWGITAAGAFLMAIVLSKMSLLVPENGGPFAYARAGLGDFIGFQTVYNHWIAIWVGNLALVIALLGYLSSLWPVFASPINSTITSIGILWILTLVNIRGVKTAGILQFTTTILRLIPIIFLIALGIAFFNPHYITENFDLTIQPPISDITQAAGLTLWAFIGIESAVIPYSYVENPQKNIPLATLVGTAVSAIIYIVSSIIITGILPHQILVNAASPFVTTAQLIFGETWGKWFMTLGAIISCFGCINGWTMMQGQVAMAAAEKKLFPNIFAQRNKFNVPALGMVITVVLQSILLLMTTNQDTAAQFSLIILMASLATLIPFFYAMVGALVVIKRTENAPIKTGIYFMIASIATLYAFWAMFMVGEKALFYGSILVLSSAVLYGWGYGNKSNRSPGNDGM